MASPTIEHVPDELLDQLRKRATSHQQSLSEQALQVLERGFARDTPPPEAEIQVRQWERLAGRWQSEKPVEEEISEIYAARSRGREKEGHLKPDESERVLRLVRLYRRAAEVLGGAEEARAWMQEPNFALGEDTPLRFADTEPGTRRVKQLLGQIEYGVAT